MKRLVLSLCLCVMFVVSAHAEHQCIAKTNCLVWTDIDQMSKVLSIIEMTGKTPQTQAMLDKATMDGVAIMIPKGTKCKSLYDVEGIIAIEINGKRLTSMTEWFDCEK